MQQAICGAKLGRAALSAAALVCGLLVTETGSLAQAGGLKWVGLRVQYHLFINISKEKEEITIDTMSIELLQGNQAKVCFGSGANACQVTTYSQNNGVYSLGSNILGHYSIRLVSGGLFGEWRWRPGGGPIDGRFILKSAS